MATNNNQTVEREAADKDFNASLTTSESAFTEIKGSRKATDKVFTVLFYCCMALALIPTGMGSPFGLVVRGVPSLLSPSWWTALSGVTIGSTNGGVAHAIIGTIIQALLTALMTVPIGIFVAICTAI